MGDRSGRSQKQLSTGTHGALREALKQPTAWSSVCGLTASIAESTSITRPPGIGCVNQGARHSCGPRRVWLIASKWQVLPHRHHRSERSTCPTAIRRYRSHHIKSPTTSGFQSTQRQKAPKQPIEFPKAKPYFLAIVLVPGLHPRRTPRPEIKPWSLQSEVDFGLGCSAAVLAWHPGVLTTVSSGLPGFSSGV